MEEALIVYSLKLCESGRKAKNWLEKKRIDYIDRDIRVCPFSTEELIGILRVLPNGVEDLISQRSYTYKKLGIDFDQCSLNEVLYLMSKYPSLIKKPIVKKGKKIVVGFNEDEMGVFIPKIQRKIVREKIVKSTAAEAFILTKGGL